MTPIKVIVFSKRTPITRFFDTISEISLQAENLKEAGANLTVVSELIGLTG